MAPSLYCIASMKYQAIAPSVKRPIATCPPSAAATIRHGPSAHATSQLCLKGPGAKRTPCWPASIALPTRGVGGCVSGGVGVSMHGPLNACMGHVSSHAHI